MLVQVGNGSERPEEFVELLEGLVAEWKPGTTLEDQLVQQLASHLWRLRRVYRAETGAIQMQADAAADDWVDHGRARQAEASQLIRETKMQDHVLPRPGKRLRDITVDDQLALRGDWSPTTELETKVESFNWFWETLKNWNGLEEASTDVSFTIAVAADRAGVEIEPILGIEVDLEWDYDDVERAGVQVALKILAEYCKLTGSNPEEALEDIRADFEEQLANAVETLKARELAEESVRMMAAVPNERVTQTLLRYEAHIAKQIDRTLRLLMLIRAQRLAD